jgi:lantibiotic biosynthesis protein
LSAGSDLRWRAAIVGVHRLLGDIGVAPDARPAVVSRLRAESVRQSNDRVDDAVREELAATYRRVEDDVLKLLEEGGEASGLPGAFAVIFDRRARRVRTVATRLQRLVARGTVAIDLHTLAGCFVQTHLNRLFRADVRLHELAIYDVLGRAYDRGD